MEKLTTVEAIRARLEAATPGPWDARGLNNSTVVLSRVEGSYGVASLGDPLDSKVWHNAEFIAHAPTDVARMLRALVEADTLASHWEHHSTHGDVGSILQAAAYDLRRVITKALGADK